MRERVRDQEADTSLITQELSYIQELQDKSAQAKNQFIQKMGPLIQIQQQMSKYKSEMATIVTDYKKFTQNPSAFVDQKQLQQIAF